MAAPILGDMLYRAASLWTRLAGNTTTTKKFLRQTGTGAGSAVPAWDTIVASDLPNTAVTPGSYTSTNLTVDAQGRLTAASNGSSGAGTVTNTGTLTNRNVILGNGTTDVRALGALGSTGEVLTSQGASSDPIWSAVTGTGTVTTTGSPASGNLTKFSGATSITNGDLTGDVTTAGGVATTLANSGVSAATYTNATVTFDAKGRATAAASGELDYVEFTSPVSPTNTTEGTADTIVTGSAVSYNGSTIVLVEFFANNARPAISNGANLTFWLYDGSASIGQMGLISAAAASGGANCPVRLTRRITPSNASHTYSVRASVSTGTGLVSAGAGGITTVAPGFIRITRA